MRTILVSLAILKLCAVACIAETRSENTTMYSDYGDSPIATIVAGTEMSVLDTVNGFLLIKIVGYIPLTPGGDKDVFAPTAPSKKSSVTTSSSNNRSSDSYSGRCQAITKKGTQCKRNAQPGRTRCWQH